MSYAVLAGLPPIYGLFSAMTPPLAYTLLGSSRHLSIGPVALVWRQVCVHVGTTTTNRSTR